MEVDEGVRTSVLTDTPSSVSVSLHPLVVMNISDHFTRIRVQEGGSGNPPKGLFLNEAHQPHATVPIQCMVPCWECRKGAVLRYVTHLSCW